MPLELTIIILFLSIPIIAGAVCGFTSNTMTQNNIPSMRDMDSEVEQEMTWDQFGLSDPIANNDNLAMELPPLSIEKIQTGDQAIEQSNINLVENTPPAARTVSMVPDEVGVEVNRFFNLFNKQEMEPETTLTVDPIQDQNSYSDNLTSVSEVVLTSTVERTVSVLPEEVGAEVNRFLKFFKKEEETEPAAVLEEPHYVDQMLGQIDSCDIPPPTEEDVAAESPLSEIAFRSIAKNYGFETASQITTTPLLGAKQEEDVMMGRIQFLDGETCLVYEDSYVFLRGSAIEKVTSNEGIVVLVKGFFFDDGFIVGELIRQEELVVQEAM